MEYIIKYTGDILSLGYPTELLDAQFAIMELRDQPPSRLLEHRQVTFYEPARHLSCLAERSMEAACIPPVQRETGLTGKGVLIGLVDSGLDLNHPEFLGEDGLSRVVALWDMTAEGTPPEGFLRGAVFSREEIAAGLAPSADQEGHGTAVAAIAAGRSGVAPGASIAAVKLASSRTTDVMRAVKFLLDQADRLEMPCVVNLSYGTNCGSHQGQSLFESYIDQSSQRGRTVIVCAAGNEGSGAHHFRGKLMEGGTRFLRFGSIRVSVFYGVPTHYSASQEAMFLLEGPAGAMDGLWQLRCRGRRVSDGRFDVWLPTVEEVTERTAFLQPEPDLTITLPATALYPISVGGFRPETETASPFSGRGDQACAGRVILDLMAPAESVRSAKAGGGYDVFTGTSMAAPFVSGSAALMMEWGIVQGNDLFLYGQRVKAFLSKGALRSPFLTYPNPQWGYGRLNLCGTMRDLINHVERGL